MNPFQKIKEDIDLTSYLVSNGFTINPKKSTQKTKVYNKGDIKLLIFQPQNTNYKLFKDINTEKGGSIIDFMVTYENKELKDIINNIPKKENLPKPINIIETKRDKSREIMIAYIYNKIPNYQPNTLKKIDEYLLQRNINPKILTNERFQNTIKINEKYQNLFIPHFENQKVIGAQLIKDKEKRLLKDGAKSNYTTNHFKNNDTELVITESFIDLTSYYTLHNEKLKNTLGIDTSGEITNITKKNIADILGKKNNIKNIVIATDNDKKGNELATKIENIVIDTNTKKEAENLLTTTRYNLEPYKDLNDKLTNKILQEKKQPTQKINSHKNHQ